MTYQNSKRTIAGQKSGRLPPNRECGFPGQQGRRWPFLVFDLIKEGKFDGNLYQITDYWGDTKSTSEGGGGESFLTNSVTGMLETKSVPSITSLCPLQETTMLSMRFSFHRILITSLFKRTVPPRLSMRSFTAAHIIPGPRRG